MRKVSLLAAVALAVLAHAPSAGQSTGFSLKAGPSVAIQAWDSYDRDPLFGYHLDVQAESISDQPRSFYASLGYHRRGSAIRTRAFQGRDAAGNIQTVNPADIKFLFNNVALALGAKQHRDLGNVRGHISLALRGEVNVSTDLGGEEAERVNQLGIGLPYPTDEFVNRFVYGVDVGLGADVPLGPALDGLLELRVSPDLSRQYFQPAFRYFDVRSGNNQNSPDRSINNITFELSLGLRWINFAE